MAHLKRRVVRTKWQGAQNRLGSMRCGLLRVLLCRAGARPRAMHQPSNAGPRLVSRAESFGRTYIRRLAGMWRKPDHI